MADCSFWAPNQNPAATLNHSYSLHDTDEAKCVSTYIQSDPLLDTRSHSKSAQDFLQIHFIHLNCCEHEALHFSFTSLSSTPPPSPQCHTVCGGKKSCVISFLSEASYGVKVLTRNHSPSPHTKGREVVRTKIHKLFQLETSKS